MKAQWVAARIKDWYFSGRSAFVLTLRLMQVSSVHFRISYSEVKRSICLVLRSMSILAANVPFSTSITTCYSQQQGKWLLRDLSRNGTFVDGKRIVKDIDQELEGNEKIKISVPLDASNDSTLVE